LEQLFQKYPKVVSEEFLYMRQVKAYLRLKNKANSMFLKSRIVPFTLKEKVEVR